MGKITVLVIALAIIYYIGREVLASFRHLTDEELLEFWSGRMKAEEPAQQRRCSEHLGSCGRCSARLDEIRKHNAGPGADSPMIERKY